MKRIFKVTIEEKIVSENQNKLTLKAKITILLIYISCILVSIYIFLESLINNTLKFSRLLALFSLLPLLFTFVYNFIKKLKLKKLIHKLEVIEFIPTGTLTIFAISGIFYNCFTNMITIPEDYKIFVDCLPNIITAFSIIIYFITLTKDRIKHLFFS